MIREMPWNLIISKLKKESTSEENSQLEAWLSDSGNRELFEELQGRRHVLL